MKLEGRSGAYLVGAALGAGGMATVHRAVRLGERVEGEPSAVAIKRLHPHVAADPSIVARFRNEAKIAERLAHPNIVRTIDMIEAEPAPAIVMELCDGASLLQLAFATWNRGESVPARVASAIVLDLCAALGAAHEALDDDGAPDPIIHRDVSPHNVLVDRAGVAKLADFGIARVRDWTTSTGSGDLKGKIAYMAPELFSGQRASVASDLYGAGVVLWELLANERLFEGEVAEILGKMLAGNRDEVDLATRGLPAEVGAVVMRAIATQPERRYESAAIMAAALRNALPPATRVEVAAWVERASLALPGEDEALVPPSSATLITRSGAPPGRTRGTWPWIAAAIAAVTGGGLAYLLGVGRPPPSTGGEVTAEPTATALASVAEPPPEPSVAPPPPSATVAPPASSSAEPLASARAPSIPGRTTVPRTRASEEAHASGLAVIARNSALSACEPAELAGSYSVTFLPTGHVIVAPFFGGEPNACMVMSMTTALKDKIIPSDGKPLSVVVGVSGPR